MAMACSNQPVYFRRTYDEALALVEEARNYVAYVEPRERPRLDFGARLEVSCESMRVTSRLTQVMAWLLMQRAVAEGEISLDQAITPDNRLGGQEVCLKSRANNPEGLPKSLKSLMERSLNLYIRISRLENRLLETLH
jgi:regulator of CtrA degradation